MVYLSIYIFIINKGPNALVYVILRVFMSFLRQNLGTLCGSLTDFTAAAPRLCARVIRARACYTWLTLVITCALRWRWGSTNTSVTALLLLGPACPHRDRKATPWNTLAFHFSQLVVPSNRAAPVCLVSGDNWAVKLRWLILSAPSGRGLMQHKLKL